MPKDRKSYATKPYTNLDGFIKTIIKTVKDIKDDEILLYRGQADYNWDITPSIKRKDFINKENIFIREIISSFPNDFRDDKTTLDYLIRAQHYELPTRLIDLTLNPLVALYFSLSETIELDENNNEKYKEDGAKKFADGAVFVLKVKKEQIKYYDSDTASCIANLAFLSKDEKDTIKNYCQQYVNKENNEKDAFKSELMKTKEFKRLLHFIKLEKNHFDDNINPSDLLSNIIIKGKMNNNRILAQRGAFLLCGLGEPNFDILLKFKISAENKRPLKEELDKVMSINDASMFPEIMQHSKYIKEKI
ncbi:FRG domain-containing protein [Frederiksenia canicola]|uniref:FRG domain-containing protein n=1 Tax=Frederiksenia canicola TaxID=123824 RepID=A0AAE6X767_9PAST|nr:FRG domain-containing protein [Frederiksenia canicola]QIM64714.1 hypothetical protein A4G17_04315 [Frederiksenia canicola]RPE91205.1 FRG domain-containing protein [Frederiksenia canicola]